VTGNAPGVSPVAIGKSKGKRQKSKLQGKNKKLDKKDI